MYVVNHLKAYHVHQPIEVGQYCSRTEPNGAAWMHSRYSYPMGMAKGSLCTFCLHSDQNETSSFAVVQSERAKELKMGSLSKNALGLLLRHHVKGSIVIWTRLSREKTNLSKHHSLYSWVGSGVPWSWRVTWAPWALGEFAGLKWPTLV